MSPVYPLITRDPISGGELLVTRLACPASGVTIEGNSASAGSPACRPSSSNSWGSYCAIGAMCSASRPSLASPTTPRATAWTRLSPRWKGHPRWSQRRPARDERLVILNRLAAGEVTLQEALGLLGG